MPGQADKQAAIVAKVSRPPRLRLGQQRLEIGLECLVLDRANPNVSFICTVLSIKSNDQLTVKSGKGGSVVELSSKRILLG